MKVFRRGVKRGMFILLQKTFNTLVAVALLLQPVAVTNLNGGFSFSSNAPVALAEETDTTAADVPAEEPVVVEESPAVEEEETAVEEETTPAEEEAVVEETASAEEAVVEETDTLESTPASDTPVSEEEEAATPVEETVVPAQEEETVTPAVEGDSTEAPVEEAKESQETAVEEAPVSEETSEEVAEVPASSLSEQVCLSASVSGDSETNWTVDGDRAVTNDVVELGVRYVFPLDKEVSVTFTCLPADESKRAPLSIERIKTSDINLPDGTVAVSDYAYDITTDGMDNGDFKYDLTLPKSTDEDVTLSYIEKSADDVKGKILSKDDVKQVDDEDVDNNNETVVVSDLDHFTIFIVSAELSVYASFNGETQVTVYPSTSVTISLTATTSGSGSDDDWNSSAYLIEGGSWTCVDTPNNNGDDTYTETFNITAPSSVGVYDVSFRAYNSNSCSTGVSSDFTLTDGITVSPVSSAPFAETFGSSNSSTIADWYENNPAEATSGSGEDAPTDGKFAKIGEDGWICRPFDATGFATVELTYDWKGDSDAEGSDDGEVEYKTTGACGDSSGWTNIASHDLNDTSWGSESHSLTGNTIFNLRFRGDSSSSDEYFRVDNISLGVPAVPDTEAPVIEAHSSITAEATSGSGAVVTYTNPTATDNVDPSVTVTCLPASGSTFPLGTTVVACNASDVAGNDAVETEFDVTVEDTTNPVVVVTAGTDSVVAHTSFTDAGATWTDNYDGSGAISSATSGTVDIDVVGDYTLTYSYTDTNGNTGSADRIVSVTEAPAPVISNENSTASTATSVTISWTTDNPSTSRVVYGTEPVSDVDSAAAGAPNYGYPNSTVEDSNFVTSHSVTVTGLSSGTTYYFRPVSHGSPESVGDEIVAETIGTTTNAATGVTTSDATLNGVGNSDATAHSFWVSLSTFSTASPSIPVGVYSTPAFGAVLADTPFSATLASITTTGVPSNLPAVTPGTTYYFAAWTEVSGTWYPGEVLSFTTEVPDTTAPVITLTGANPQVIELGAGYTELGATTDDGSSVVINATGFVDAVGSYSVYYNSTDSANNVATQVIRTVNVVDTTGPVAPGITSPTTEQAFKTVPILNEWSAVTDLSGIDEYRIEYIYDDGHTFSGAPYRTVAGTSRNHSPGLSEQGGVTIRVQAFDNAGNEGAWSAPVHYYYDATIPGSDPTGFSSNPVVSTLSDDQTVDVSWTTGGTDDISGVDGYSYDFTQSETGTPDDIKDIEENVTEVTSPVLTDGTWYFHIRTVDNAGNWTSTAHVGPFLIDATAPDVEITSPVEGFVTGDVDIRGSVTDANPHHYYLVIRNASNVQVAGPGTVNDSSSFTDKLFFTWDTTGVADGVYTVRLEARDAADNKDAGSVDVHTVTVDNTAPTADLVFSGTGPSFTSFDVVFSEDVKEAEAENPANYFLTNWPGFGGSGDLVGDATVTYNSGTYTATVVFDNPGWYVSPEQTWGVQNVHDLAGNLLAVSPYSETSTPMVDPVTTDDADTNWHNSDVTITLSCSDVDGSGCKTTYYTTNGDTPTVASSTGNSVVVSAEGETVIKYFSVDNAGNEEEVQTAANTVKIDKTVPAVDAGTDKITDSDFSQDATATDALSGIATYAWSKVSGPGAVTFGTPDAEDTTVSVDTIGNYVLRLTVTDNAGNSNSDDFTKYRLSNFTAHKWNDIDASGIKEEGEISLSDWQMELYLGSSCEESEGEGEGLSLGTMSTDENGNATFTGLLPGEYSVKETMQEGWRNITPLCQSATLTAGEDGMVSFGNQELGTITINKLTNDEESDEVFFFTPSYGDVFTLVGNGGSNFSGFLVPGTYTITEQEKGGWELDNLTCVDNAQNSTSVVSGATATITLGPGNDVTCTYANDDVKDDSRWWLEGGGGGNGGGAGDTLGVFTFGTPGGEAGEGEGEGEEGTVQGAETNTPSGNEGENGENGQVLGEGTETPSETDTWSWWWLLLLLIPGYYWYRKYYNQGA